jgi:hypothetical protein
MGIVSRRCSNHPVIGGWILEKPLSKSYMVDRGRNRFSRRICHAQDHETQSDSARCEKSIVVTKPFSIKTGLISDK